MCCLSKIFGFFAKWSHLFFEQWQWWLQWGISGLRLISKRSLTNLKKKIIKIYYLCIFVDKKDLIRWESHKSIIVNFSYIESKFQYSEGAFFKILKLK